jgi:DNA repair protein RecN (Recombination protein N)
VVEGCFDISALNLRPFFQTYDLDYADETFIRREIADTGKSRAFINDTPVTLQLLKELSEQLVDIHSQHQNLLFQQASFGLTILDEYAGNQALLSQYQSRYKQYKQIESQYVELLDISNKEELKRDFLQYQVTELTEANLTPNEQLQLEKEQTFLQNVHQIKTQLYQVSASLSEQEDNVIQRLYEACQGLNSIVEFDEEIASLQQRMNSNLLEIKDIAYSLTKKEQAIEVDPAALELISSRLDRIYTLQQKHHVNSIVELLQKLQEYEDNLLIINNYQSQLEAITKEKESLRQLLKEDAKKLSEKRKSVVSSLEKEMCQKASLLGMEESVFKIEITVLEELSSSGTDKVRFLFSANKGVGVEEIAKVASGGELSRLMLAVKSILTASSFLPTVIFDEIDNGISGEVAGKVAMMMQEIAKQRQLIVITHLPQIAAKGNLHYFVYKEKQTDSTATHLRALSEKERVSEIAKMMSGDDGTASSAAAQELMNLQIQ